MSQQILNDGDSGLTFRSGVNANFTELYELTETISAWHTATPTVQTLNATPQNLVYLDTLAYEKYITYDNTTGTFTVIKAGGYDFSMFMSASWANGLEVYFSAWVNGSQKGNDFVVTGLGNPKENSITIPSFIQIPANGTFEIRARVDSGDKDITINAGTTKLDLMFYN